MEVCTFVKVTNVFTLAIFLVCLLRVWFLRGADLRLFSWEAVTWPLQQCLVLWRWYKINMLHIQQLAWTSYVVWEFAYSLKWVFSFYFFIKHQPLDSTTSDRLRHPSLLLLLLLLLLLPLCRVIIPQILISEANIILKWTLMFFFHTNSSRCEHRRIQRKGKTHWLNSKTRLNFDETILLMRVTCRTYK
jgi:hypothetical protein